MKNPSSGRSENIVALIFLLLVALVISLTVYWQAERLLPKDIALMIKPETLYYEQKAHSEMKRELVIAFNIFQQGQKQDAITRAEKVYKRGIDYFDGRKPDFEDQGDRLISDRILATSSWLAGWNTNDAALSRSYAQMAYEHSLGLNGETDFWTVSHLYDVGSRSLDLREYDRALNAYSEIVDVYARNKASDFSDLDRVIKAHVQTARLQLRNRNAEGALRTIEKIFDVADKDAKKELTKLYNKAILLVR